MSVIEDALRKSSAQRPRSNFVASSWCSRVNAAPAPEVPARHFRAAATDPEVIEKNHVLLGVSDVSVTRAYKILRTRVLHRLAANNWRSIGITGTTAGEGKSLTAINLALALAQEVNTWVFLVEDRKSTRLNSSHGYISYAVFCLKKKKPTTNCQ